jgi:hypothetical protein
LQDNSSTFRNIPKHNIIWQSKGRSCDLRNLSGRKTLRHSPVDMLPQLIDQTGYTTNQWTRHEWFRPTGIYLTHEEEWEGDSQSVGSIEEE